MSRVCQSRGKGPKRVIRFPTRTIANGAFLPNLHTHRFWSETEKRFLSLRVSTRGLRTIEKRGVDVVVADLRAKASRFKEQSCATNQTGFFGGHRPLLHDHEKTAPAPDKLETKKFDPVVRKHVPYKIEDQVAPAARASHARAP